MSQARCVESGGSRCAGRSYVRGASHLISPASRSTRSSILRDINVWLAILLADYVHRALIGMRALGVRSRNPDGGYGIRPGQRTTVTSTYFASSITHSTAELVK